MTLEKINELTLDDVVIEIVYRLLQGEDFVLTLPDEAEQTRYIDYVVSGADKPSLEEAQAEFLIYKQELIDEENARLAEVARMKDIEDRLTAMSDTRAAFYSLYPETPNSALWIKQNILDADAVTAEANLVALENADSEQKAQRDAVAYVEKRKAEYPSIEELIVAMWEGDQTKIDELEAVRQAIKTKYPKP